MLGYERIEKIQNITVGIFIIFGLIALGWLIFKFNDFPTAVSKFNSYEVGVQFASSPGAQKDTPVRFCGYQVGRVTDVKPPEMRDELKDGVKTGRRYFQSLVIMNIDKQFSNIPTNVDVQLITRGLGSSYIEMAPEPNLPEISMEETGVAPSLFLRNGMVLQGHVGTSTDLLSAETQKKVDELLNSLILVINNTNDIIGDVNNKENVKLSLANLSEATAETKAVIKQFETFMVSANQTTEELTGMLKSAKEIMAKIDSGQGSAGRLVNDARFYESLLENSKQLNMLLEEMQKFVKKLNEKGIKVQL